MDRIDPPFVSALGPGNYLWFSTYLFVKHHVFSRADSNVRVGPTCTYLYRKHRFAVPNPQHFRGM